MRKIPNSSVHFYRYNANPGKADIPDCAVRSVSLALKMPYVDVCRRLGVSFRDGHGLIRNSGIYMQKLKDEFDDYFDVVVDFEEELPDDALPEVEYDTAALFDDGEIYGRNDEMTLSEWMELNRGTGRYIVGLHSPSSKANGHLVCVSTNRMEFYDTWDCSDWKVDAWMRVRRRYDGA